MTDDLSHKPVDASGQLPAAGSANTAPAEQPAAASPQSSAPAESAKSEEATAASPIPQASEVGRSPAVVFLRRTAYVVLSAAIMTVGLYGGYAVLKNRAASEAAPPLLEGIPFSSVLYSRENVLLRIVPAADGIFRVKTPLESIDPKLVEATIAYEDRNFYKHPGFDLLALIRSAASTYIGGWRTGASTITMQLARMRLHLQTDTPDGKLRQIWHAMRYEAHYTKRQILEAYLNLAPYGSNVEGAEAAAAVWFHKEASHLTPAEVAALAVIPQNPVKRRPYTQGSTPLDTARLRLARILVDQGVYPPSAAAALRAPLEVFGPEHLPFLAPHYAQTVLNRIVGTPERSEPNADKTAFKAGKLKGTLSLDVQSAMEALVRETIARLSPWGVKNAALSVVDARDRSVLAMVGSANFFDPSIQGEVNAWTAKRSPGSMLKPFTYALALDQGLIHEKTVLIDSPIAIGGWAPDNADGSFRGPLSAEDALVLSRNIPAVDLEKRLSPGLSEFLRRAGVELPHDKNWYGLSLVLGGAEITMADAAKLYAMVAGEGLLRPLRLLEAQASPAEADVLSREAQFVLRRMLASRGESVTIRGARRELLYKTGTSNGWRDAWTAGMVGPYVIVVWLGDFAGRPNPQLQGAHLAAPLFRAAALRLGNIPALDWPAAVSAQQEAEDKHLKVALEPVCAATGDLDIRLCSRRTNAWILPGRTSVRDSGVFREIWIDKETGLRACGPGPGIERRVWEFWPTHFQKVFLAAGIAKEPPPPYTAQCAERLGVPGGRAPVITSPKAGAAIYSPAGFDAARVLLAAGADPDAAILYWYADGAFLGARQVGKALEWSAPAGTHELAVVDDLGRTSTMRLTIRRR